MTAVGIDLVEVRRIEKALQTPAFLQRVFGAEERTLFEAVKFRPQTIAANFCAKEAFSKAIGTGIRGFSLNEVQVLRDELGKPYYLFSGRALEIVNSRRLACSVSLTHTKAYAAAAALASWEE